MQAQRTYNGLCRRAGLAASVTLQRFDGFHLGFQRGIAKPLQRWRPDGVVLRMNQLEQLETLRQMLPGIPFVSTLLVPSEIAETCVTSDITEVIILARDHFRSQKVAHVAMFCSAIPYAAAPRIAAFRAVVPGGLYLEHTGDDSPRGLKGALKWLESLPKPVGVMALEIGAAPFLLRCCKELGLRVPQDVQIIGADDDDVSLACEPHLTSVHLPGHRIGETAMDAMLRHLRKKRPLPPALIPVGGGLLVARGSTGELADNTARVNQAVKLMQTHLHQDLSVARLAKMMGMGLTSFYKEFDQVMGVAPARHLRQLRLEAACRMLRETESTVTQIAKECGFNGLIAFVQFFRRQTGQTPTEYREGRTSK
jgi:LacI family transcriptional regulator